MGKPRGRPARAPGETRERLLAAAADIFNREGYFATDTNRIAKAAGFAPATFYRCFKDKLEIFLEAYARWVFADWAAVEAAIAGVNGAAAQARAIAEAHGAYHARWVGFRRSMQALTALDAKARAFHLKVREGQLARARALLAAAGAPPPADADLLFAFLAIERAGNAAADGELAPFGVAPEAFRVRIEAELLGLLTGERPGRGGVEGAHLSP